LLTTIFYGYGEFSLLLFSISITQPLAPSGGLMLTLCPPSAVL